MILEKYKLPLHTLDEVRFMVGNGIPKLIERAIPQGRENPDFDKILTDFISYYEEHCAIKTAPYAGIPECIKALRAAGIKIIEGAFQVDHRQVVLLEHFFEIGKEPVIALVPGIGIKMGGPVPALVLAAQCHIPCESQEDGLLRGRTAGYQQHDSRQEDYAA